MLQRAISVNLLAAAILTALPAIAGTALPSPCVYSGEAVVASVDLLGIKTALSDTGQLPSTGGFLSAQLANATLPGVLSLQLLSASTSGASGRTSSQASVANAAVSVAGISITAAVLTSNATAQACGINTQPSVSGGSNIADLKVNGLSVTVTGAPNQVIPLLVGSLIINEQTSSVTNSAAGGTAEIVVNALHLKLLGVADVVVSSSHAGVCSGNTCKAQ
jgi:hypothetical protein